MKDYEQRATAIIMNTIEGVKAQIRKAYNKGYKDGKMRKGHWIWNFDKGYCKCSECGIGMGHKEFDYCPNCGAKMEANK